MNKIVIKNLNTDYNFIDLFPFFLLLNKKYPEAEYSIISDKPLPVIAQFLPMKLKNYCPSPKVKNIFEIHRYCVNLNDIFNVDVFIDFENTWKSPLYGYFFKSPIRIGNKHPLINTPIKNKINEISEKSLSILEKIFKEEITLEYIMDATKSKYDFPLDERLDLSEKLFKIPDPPKFIFLMLHNLQHLLEISPLLQRAFTQFQNQVFVIWSSYDRDEVSAHLSQMEKSNNQLFFYYHQLEADLIYIIKKSSGTLVFHPHEESIACWLGAYPITLIPLTAIPLTWPKYKFLKFPIKRQVCHNDLEIDKAIDDIHYEFKL